MAKDSITILGLKELRNDLKNLPILKQASILRNANRKAARINVERKLIAAVPHKARKTRQRGKKPFTRKSKKQAITVNVKGSKTAVMSGISGYYFHYRFLEFGTKKRTTKNYKHKGFKRDRFGKRKSVRVAKKRLNRGVMPKTRPFAERILDKSINPLFRYLKKEYGKSIDKAIKRSKK